MAKFYAEPIPACLRVASAEQGRAHQRGKVKMQTILILHNIRSVYNTGAIFRTADTAGIFKIYLTGYTPAPVDRFGKLRKDFTKASLGAENLIWEKIKSLIKVIKNLKKEGFQIVALEQAKNSIDYKKFKAGKKLVLIAGNEVKGLSKGILKKCDKIVEIKMLGKKESLNVSVALGIVLFRILNI